jgi:DNA-binding Lrp family transcriptional regulator
VKGGGMKEIFEILEKDARTSTKQISTMTGISVEEVEKTIKKAEDDRSIVKYKTIINWDKIGDERVWALIEVRIQPQRDVGFDAIAERIYKFPEARSVYLVSGAYDVAVLIVGKSIHEVSDFVSEKLAPLEGVQGTVTHFLLRRYKEDGEILEGEEGIKRLPLTL